MDLAGGAGQSPDGRDVDDLSSLALDHPGQYALAAMEDPFDIDGKHPVPFFSGEIKQEFLLGNTSVIDQDIDIAETVIDKIQHLVDLGFVTDIRPDFEDAAVFRQQPTVQVFRSFFATMIIYGNVIATFGKERRNLPANAP